VRRPWFPWLEGRSTLAVAARAGAYGFLATRREFSTESTGRWGSFDGGPAPGRSGRNRDGRPCSSHARRRPRRPRRFRGKTPSPRPTVTAIPGDPRVADGRAAETQSQATERPPPRNHGLGQRDQDPATLFVHSESPPRGTQPTGNGGRGRTSRRLRQPKKDQGRSQGEGPSGNQGFPHASGGGLRPPGGTQPRGNGGRGQTSRRLRQPTKDQRRAQGEGPWGNQGFPTLPEPGFARREAHKPRGNGRRGRTSRRLRQPTKDQGRAQGEGPWGNQGFPHALFVFRWEVDLRDLLRLE
jgi:hypothetical protein